MLESDAAELGLTVFGGFQADDAGAPGAPAGIETLLLIGWAGADPWAVFAASPEYGDGREDPLDRWTRRVIDTLAARHGAQAFYPFGGPPWHPFQAWALRSGIAFPSPIGLLIHPRYGLWHSYRAALGFAARREIPLRDVQGNPCDSCRDRPCLTTCPVDAFSGSGFAVATCRTHLRGRGAECRSEGCLARNACPVAARERHGRAQLAFHQKAFLRGAG